MKVYVCWSVPDYIGIDIEKIFLREEDAKAYCAKNNENRPSYDHFDYDEYEVFDCMKGEE